MSDDILCVLLVSMMFISFMAYELIDYLNYRGK